MTPAEKNRAAFPEFAAIADEIRSAGGTVKVNWMANAQGDRIGPVPADWAEPFKTPPVPTHPWRANQPGQMKGAKPKPAKAPGRMR